MAIGPNLASLREMRHQVFRFLGTDNLIVGFHLQWLLSALKLRLGASSLVVLENEPVYLAHFQEAGGRLLHLPTESLPLTAHAV